MDSTADMATLPHILATTTLHSVLTPCLWPPTSISCIEGYAHPGHRLVTTALVFNVEKCPKSERESEPNSHCNCIMTRGGIYLESRNSGNVDSNLKIIMLRK